MARVIRSLFDTARRHRERFDAYGSKKNFDWQLGEWERYSVTAAAAAHGRLTPGRKASRPVARTCFFWVYNGRTSR